MSRMLILICALIWSVPGQAQDTAVKPYSNFEEFVTALYEDSPQEFQARGAITKLNDLDQWHETLSHLNPKHFENLNKKLKLLPTMGFQHQDGRWLLVDHAHDVQMGAGFHAKPLPTGFTSIVDFHRSILNETPNDFLIKLHETDPKLVESWFRVYKKIHPDTERVLSLLQLRSFEIGFKEKKQLIIGEIGFAKDGLGYPSRALLAQKEIRPIDSLKKFKNLIRAAENMNLHAVQELQQRLGVTPFSQIQKWMPWIKKNPKLAQTVGKALSVSVSVGFGEKELVPNGPSGPAQPIGFKTNVEPSNCDAGNILKELFQLKRIR